MADVTRQPLLPGQPQTVTYQVAGGYNPYGQPQVYYQPPTYLPPQPGPNQSYVITQQPPCYDRVVVLPQDQEGNSGDFVLGFFLAFFFGLIGLLIAIFAFHRSRKGRRGAFVGILVLLLIVVIIVIVVVTVASSK